MADHEIRTDRPAADRDALTEALDAHHILTATGGTATGSTWHCQCGMFGTTAGSRDHARRLGMRHVVDALLASEWHQPLLAERDALVEEVHHRIAQAERIRALLDEPWHDTAGLGEWINADDLRAALDGTDTRQATQ